MNIFHNKISGATGPSNSNRSNPAEISELIITLIVHCKIFKIQILDEYTKFPSNSFYSIPENDLKLLDELTSKVREHILNIDN
jgi:hypothetical protein